MSTDRCPVALGIDTGAHHTGIALVDAHDQVLHAEVLRLHARHAIQERILYVYKTLRQFIGRMQPAVLAIEVYTAPTTVIRARSSRLWAEHNWLIGACLALAGSGDAQLTLLLLEALEWQRQLTGIRIGPIGGKRILRGMVEARTGYRFVTPVSKEAGGHDSDAAGIALVALDRYRQAQRVAQAGGAR